jgi:hypothetical protein
MITKGLGNNTLLTKGLGGIAVAISEAIEKFLSLTSERILKTINTITEKQSTTSLHAIESVLNYSDVTAIDNTRANISIANKPGYVSVRNDNA